MLKATLVAALCAVLLSAFVAVVAFSRLSSYCALDPSPYAGIGNEQRADNHSESGGNSEHNTTAKEDRPKNPTATFRLDLTAPKTIEGSYQAADTGGENRNWGRNFFCETKITDFLLAFFTLLLVVATSWLAAVTHRLWSSTAALVKGAEDTAERELRAYLWMRAIELHDLAPGTLPSVTCQLGNSGKTPAYDTEVLASCLVYAYPLPPNTPFPSVGSTAVGTSMVVFPGDEPFSVTAAFSTKLPGLNEEQVRAILKGDTMRLYVFGLAKYRDAFDKLRETRFCSSVDASDALRGADQYAVSFDWAPQHNTAT